ncbi:MAG TPA: DoxX family protein [Acidimicrobiales bacterium]|jgi:hypothetical protein
MFIATVVISSLLAAVLLASARGKLVHDPLQMATLKKVGFPEDRAWLLASAEVAGSLGLIAGLHWWTLGVVAAAGIVAYFFGAVGSHLRARDLNIAAPTVLLLFSVVALILRCLSH